MPLAQWDSHYSVGIDSIDSQHQKLFAMINELYNSMRAGNVAQVVPDILRRLEAYCREHFTYEEGLMLKAGYPGYLAHQAEHIKLIEKALTLIKEFDESKVVRSLALLTFLKEWTQRHILYSDRHYSAHLLAAGITEDADPPSDEAPSKPPSEGPSLPGLVMGSSRAIYRT